MFVIKSKCYFGKWKYKFFVIKEISQFIVENCLNLFLSLSHLINPLQTLFLLSKPLINVYITIATQEQITKIASLLYKQNNNKRQSFAS
jgi:hypothetical protein